ncbi:MAG TPA: hypothetical protein PLT38_12175, partial [Rubrivivax sp.]|nr:hypothetical protein [Rubrivivax sp.]
MLGGHAHAFGALRGRAGIAGALGARGCIRGLPGGAVGLDRGHGGNGRGGLAVDGRGFALRRRALLDAVLAATFAAAAAAAAATAAAGAFARIGG